MTQILTLSPFKLALNERRHKAARSYFESANTGGSVRDMWGQTR